MEWLFITLGAGAIAAVGAALVKIFFEEPLRDLLRKRAPGSNYGADELDEQNDDVIPTISKILDQKDELEAKLKTVNKTLKRARALLDTDRASQEEAK